MYLAFQDMVKRVHCRCKPMSMSNVHCERPEINAVEFNTLTSIARLNPHYIELHTPCLNKIIEKGGMLVMR